jgi:hypothetical protein
MLNLDELNVRLKPWDCPVSIGGVEYRTKPLTLGMVEALISLGSEGAEQMYSTLVSLFDGEHPDFSGWTMDMVQALIAVVQDYSRRRCVENKPIISVHIKDSK